MKKWILFLCLVMIPEVSLAMYVTDNTRVTFRTGPGNDHKIIMMINSGQELSVLETRDAWSHVRIAGGKEGWIMTRWLTDEVPKGTLLANLTTKYSVLSKKYDALKVKSSELYNENKQLKSDLAISMKKARDCTQSYNTLKTDSADFIALKKEYQDAKEEKKDLDAKMKQLNDELTTKNIWWFLAGAGVLLFGIILGFSSRKKKRNSYY